MGSGTQQGRVGARLFAAVSTARAQGNGYEQKYRKSRLEIRNCWWGFFFAYLFVYFTIKVNEHCPKWFVLSWFCSFRSLAWLLR